MSLKALRTTLEDEAPEGPSEFPDLRPIRRRFAIPCFEHAVDDVPSPVCARWAEKVMQSALARAQIVADTLGSRWGNLAAKDAKSVLRAVREVDISSLTLFSNPHSVREPVAAGATRFRDHVADQYSSTATTRRLMLVVDAGAGTTDFALFNRSPSRPAEKHRLL